MTDAGEAVQALTALGYSSTDALRAVKTGGGRRTDGCGDASESGSEEDGVTE